MSGVSFVTRLKDNAAFAVVEECQIPAHRNILADQIIRLTGVQAHANCPCLLRRVVVWDPDHEREIVLKQNLTVKTFVGTSENALRVQIWTALIVLLLLKWLHHLSKAHWSLSNLASLLRLNLFTYRDLSQWLKNPIETPPLIPSPQQLMLVLG
jgi:hypothetical protein